MKASKKTEFIAVWVNRLCERCFFKQRFMWVFVTALQLVSLGIPLGANAKIDPEREKKIDDFYRIDNVVTINITMADGDWNALWAEWPMGEAGAGTGRCEHTFVGDRYQDYPVESVSISQSAFPNADFTVESADYGQPDADDILVTKKSYCGSFGASDYERNLYPSIKLKFNDSPEGLIETAIGTSNITLNNSVQDSSFIRQCLGYELVRKDVDFIDSDKRIRGLGSSRCNFAKIFVNGNLYQRTYVNVEPIKKQYTRNRTTLFNDDPDDADGNLYELEGGEDFAPIEDFVSGYDDAAAADPDAYITDGVPLLPRVSYKGFALEDEDAYTKADFDLAIDLITNVYVAIKAIDDDLGDQLEELGLEDINDGNALERIQEQINKLEQIIDMDQFIKFWAMETILQHKDGYNGNGDPNNTYVYNAVDFSDPDVHNPYTPEADRGDLNFVFYIYGIDEILKVDNAEDWNLYYSRSMLGEILYRDPYYRELLWDQIFEYVDTIFSPEAYAETGGTGELIDGMEATLIDVLPETGQDTGDVWDALSDEINIVRDAIQWIPEGIKKLYGDKIQLQIVYPTTDETEQAGAVDGHGRIWVMVSGRTKAHYTVDDFEVEIGGKPASIINGLNMFNQFWMVVEAPDMTAEGQGRYDLTVRDTIGGTSASYSEAVEYASAGNPVDTMIVADASMSMVGCGKLEAVQNAASLFVDHANVDDRIGVVHFSDLVSLDMELQDFTDSSKDEAHAAIDAWVPAIGTAIGGGISMAVGEYDPEVRPESDWRIVLLSDGRQSSYLYPKWDDLKSIFTDNVDAEKFVIDTIGLGPDVDAELMRDIADTTSGSSRFAGIDYCQPTAMSSAETSFSINTVNPLFPLDDTFSLTNELADIYKDFAEKARMEDRIGDWTDILDDASGYYSADYYLTLESGLPEAIFALNWDGVNTSPLNMYINDVPVSDLIEGETSWDATHVQYRMPYPAPGEYKITVLFYSEPEYEVVFFNPTPYRLMVSARSMTNALTIPESVLSSLNYNMDWDSIPVNTYVGDETGPITGADVAAEITTPSGDVFEVQLVDNGSGADGAPYDGMYGGEFIPTEEGPYSVVIIVDGVDNGGIDFTRRESTDIVVGPESDDTSGGSSGGTAESSVCVLGESTVDLRDRTTVTANVAAGTYLEIGAPATLNGNGLVGGNALIRSWGEVVGWGVVNGDLTLAGELSDQGNYTINGTLTENGTPSIPVLPVKTFETGTEYQNLTGALTLTPGNYGNVGIGTNAEITLNSGVYNFASLSAWNDVIFNVNGYVEINVEGEFIFGDRSTIVGGDSLTVYTNASQVRIGTDVVFNGVLIAPNADVTVYSRTVFNGCIGAENLVLDTDVTMEQSGHALFEATGRKGSCFDWLKNGPETGVDCGGDCKLECDEVCLGQACTELGDPCDEDADCISNYCDEDFTCSLAPPAPVCSESTAADLGGTGQLSTVQNNGCMMARDGYPEWWGTRPMLLQTAGADEYPVWFTWGNACTGNGGSEMFSAPWENKFLYYTSDMCPTIIDFQGTGSGTITVTYQGG